MGYLLRKGRTRIVKEENGVFVTHVEKNGGHKYAVYEFQRGAPSAPVLE
jgi:hypothetical protein